MQEIASSEGIRNTETSPRENFAMLLANAELLVRENMERSGNAWLSAFNDLLNGVNIRIYRMKNESPEVLDPIRERVKELAQEVRVLQAQYPNGTISEDIKASLLRRLDTLKISE